MFFNNKKDDSDVVNPIVTPPDEDQMVIDTTSNNVQTPFTPGATLNINVNSSAPTSSNNSEEKVSKGEKHLAKTISKILALLISGTLVGFAAYSLISLPIRESQNTKVSYLNIKDYSYTKTIRTLDPFNKSNSKKIKDFSIVGSKLFIAECKITPDVFLKPNLVFGNNNVGVSLYELKNDIFNSTNIKTNFEETKYYIDFSLVDVGSYVIYPFSDVSSPNIEKKDIAPYSIDREDKIDISFYTLPSAETGIRKKVTIRNNNLSPFTLIDVIDVGTTLPSGYYDVVFFPSIYASNDEVKENIDDNSASNELLTSIKDLSNTLSTIKGNDERVNKVYESTYVSSLKEASLVNANTAIAISNSLDNNYVSTYLKSDTYKDFNVCTLSDESTLPKYDFYPEIRELIGYLDHAGEAYGGIRYNDLIEKNNNVIGKESVIITKKDGTNDNNAFGLILSAIRR